MRCCSTWLGGGLEREELVVVGRRQAAWGNQETANKEQAEKRTTLSVSDVQIRKTTIKRPNMCLFSRSTVGSRMAQMTTVLC